MSVYLKAIYAAVFTAFGSTSTAYISGHGHIGLVAGLGVAAATLSAGFGVAGVTNAPAKAAK